jgi:hypothetical protein
MDGRSDVAVRCGFEMMSDREFFVQSRVAAHDVINMDMINVDVTNVESHRCRLPRSSSDFLLDGLLQVRCPGVRDVYHLCVNGAKGEPAHFASRCGEISRKPARIPRWGNLRHDGRA